MNPGFLGIGSSIEGVGSRLPAKRKKGGAFAKTKFVTKRMK